MPSIAFYCLLQLLNPIRQIPSICKDKAFYISPFKTLLGCLCSHFRRHLVFGRRHGGRSWGAWREVAGARVGGDRVARVGGGVQAAALHPLHGGHLLHAQELGQVLPPAPHLLMWRRPGCGMMMGSHQMPSSTMVSLLPLTEGESEQMFLSNSESFETKMAEEVFPSSLHPRFPGPASLR